MLARRHRLRRGEDYRRVVRRGIRCGGALLVTSVLPSAEPGPARFGFIASKQVGSAVVRNTIRRRLKAISAELLAEIPDGIDIVIRALPPSSTASFAELRAEVSRCLDKALRTERAR